MIGIGYFSDNKDAIPSANPPILLCSSTITAAPVFFTSFRISSSGNGTNFGDLSQARRYAGGTDDGSRGVHGGGASPSYVDTIDYLSIGAAGNSADFGNLTASYAAGSGVSNGSRGVFSTLESPTANVDAIDYITIGVLSNATDFAGELSQARGAGTACSGT